MQVHLIDGTYELFRHHFGAPPHRAQNGQPVGATAGLMRSLLGLIRHENATHVAVAFDHVIQSFRNDLFAGYKTGEGIEPELRAQFELAERATCALGFVVWPMVEFEADDALATGARLYSKSSRVSQVLICSPDKDLSQCVIDDRVVTYDRRRQIVRDRAGVREKFGVAPESIPDYLALVGDTADGIPGIARWGAKSAAAVLAAYETLEAIPLQAARWSVKVRGALTLAENLRTQFDDALLYRRLATLRTDVPIVEGLHDLLWRGPDHSGLKQLLGELAIPELASDVPVPN